MRIGVAYGRGVVSAAARVGSSYSKEGYYWQLGFGDVYREECLEACNETRMMDQNGSKTMLRQRNYVEAKIGDGILAPKKGE